MDENKQAEKKEENTTPAVVEEKREPSQEKKGRSRLDTLKYNRDRLSKEIAEEEAKNPEVIPVEDENKPVTFGDLKRIQREQVRSTALGIVSKIQDENERNGVEQILRTRIVPSDDPEKDVAFARAAYNSEKNMQVASEASRRGTVVVNRGSGSGAPSKEEDRIEPTELEIEAARMVGKRTDKEIMEFVKKARAREQHQ